MKYMYSQKPMITKNKWHRDGRTLKVRQSRDPLNKRYLEHFEKLAKGCVIPPTLNRFKCTSQGC